VKFVSNLKAVTFDVGGTLIKPWPSVGHVYSEIAARHGKKLPAALLNQRFSNAWRALKHFHHGRDEWAALVDRTFAGLIDPPPSETFFGELFDRFSEPDAWRIFDDVRPALDSLAARGINLGIISNWDDRLGPLLAKLGLSKYFEAIIISCDIGFTKPSPIIFEHAAKKLGLPPGQILHIGDSPDHDVTGAKNAGYQALLLDRDAEDSQEGTIKSLLALENI
jgi:putative hydrolase of the HAD superfamily